MIHTKEELKLYKEKDRIALWQKRDKPRFVWSGSIAQLIWKYERKLRNYEYHLNNKHKIRSMIYKYACNSLGLKLGFDIAPNTFGPGLDIVHIGYIVVSPKSKIGKNCMIYQGVTIGEEKSHAPVIGDNVCILLGAKIFGNIHVGNNVMIGANSVVNKDVPDNARVGGAPAHILNYNGNEYVGHFDIN